MTIEKRLELEVKMSKMAHLKATAMRDIHSHTKTIDRLKLDIQTWESEIESMQQELANLDVPEAPLNEVD